MRIRGRGRPVRHRRGAPLALAGAAVLIWACGDRGAPSTPAPPASPPPAPSSPVAPPDLDWPVGGERGRDWVIASYVDLDSGPGRRDYRGGTRVTGGHQGIDLTTPNFRWMDRDLPPVLAAASGRVTDLLDGEFDRNIGSGHGPWNFVEVTHEDGSRTIYGHLKKGSVAVFLGQTVDQGQQIGVVGSSGDSGWPHLHFEVRSPDEGVLDPFLEGMWVDPPSYDTPLSVMDYSVVAAAIRGDGWRQQLADPPPNADSVRVGQVLGIGVSLGGGSPGDSAQIVLRDGLGSVRGNSIVAHIRWGHSRAFWNTTILGEPGNWEIAIEGNTETFVTHAFQVLPAE